MSYNFSNMDDATLDECISALHQERKSRIKLQIHTYPIPSSLLGTPAILEYRRENSVTLVEALTIINYWRDRNKDIVQFWEEL